MRLIRVVLWAVFAAIAGIGLAGLLVYVLLAVRNRAAAALVSPETRRR